MKDIVKSKDNYTSRMALLSRHTEIPVGKPVLTKVGGQRVQNMVPKESGDTNNEGLTGAGAAINYRLLSGRLLGVLGH
jgi:hypothetical protein